jgi:hypothetical protein
LNGQPGQRLIECEKVDGCQRRLGRRQIADGHPEPAALPLLSCSPAGMIDQNPPHRIGRRSQDLPTITPRNLTLLGQSHVRLMDQSRCLQRMARPLAAQLTRGQLAQFLIQLGQ